MKPADRLRRALEPVLALEPAAPALPDAAFPETLAYLGAEAAARSLAADAYWPKWDSPWWRMTLLFEAGRASAIPAPAVRALTDAVGRYHTAFPFKVEDVPAGVDPIFGIMCHCALGTADRVLTACGVDVDRAFPWIRPWYARYQMADGGYNCDEEAYVRPAPRSSVVSTLPPAEALLARASLSGPESAALDRVAAYLLARRLHRSVSKGGAVIDPAWLEPAFPRFYEYDVLRGLTFVVNWARRRNRTIEADAVADVVEHLVARTGAAGLPAGRRAWAGAKTFVQDAAGAWTRGHPVRSFALLDEVGVPGRPDPFLTLEWRQTARDLTEVLV
jgi:hypothetical protein